jgi:serine/threonine protein phosphatase 1
MDFAQLFRKPAAAPAPLARFPDDRVGFAVGDIHGRADLLASLLNLVEGRALSDTRPGGPPIIIFLGDYIDRGRQSKAVIDLLLTRPEGFERRCLMGNHEQAMLAFLAAPLENRGWLAHGGTETLMAYGVQPPPSLGSDDSQWLDVAAKLKEKLPDTHAAFLAGLERYVQLGDYTFVHAGIDPDKALDEQTDTDLFWIRERFLTDRRPLQHRVVHGHTPGPKPYADPRRIGIDTGAYASGILTAARFEGDEVSFIQVMDRAAEARADTAKRNKKPRRR